MSNLWLIPVCILLGLLLQRFREKPPQLEQSLHFFVIYISIPALALFYLPKLTFGLHMWKPILVPWVGFALSFVFFSFLARIYNWSKRLTGCLILTAGLGNTSFVGFPVIESLYGAEGLQTAIIVDQAGSFVVVSTLGILVATYFGGKSVSLTQMGVRLVQFPPFVAFVLAVVLNLTSTEIPDAFEGVLKRLADTVTPLSLLAVGLQLKFNFKNKHFGFLTLGLFFTLILTPLFFWLWFRYILNDTSLMTEVSIMEAAMAPMITGSIIASRYGLKPQLSSMMVGFGIPVSFITLALWYWFLNA
jgi:malate permease and related proteins